MLDYPYFKEHYSMITMDLGKQQVLDADPKAIQQIHFNENPDRGGKLTMFFIIEEVKNTILDFAQGNMTLLWIYFALTY